MNALVKPALAAVVLAATIASAPASALTTGGPLWLDVQSAVSNGTVFTSVTDGVATLTGNADRLSKEAAERAALADPSIDRVVNLIDAS